MTGTETYASSQGRRDDTRLIDFEVDAQEIYASFVQAYNINLFEAQGRLTWPEFIRAITVYQREQLYLNW